MAVNWFELICKALCNGMPASRQAWLEVSVIVLYLLFSTRLFVTFDGL